MADDFLVNKPTKDKNVFFVKYPIYVGGNRGRGQVYPTGEKTNNNVFASTANGKIQDIKQTDKNSEVSILTADGVTKMVAVPKELPLIVKLNDIVKQDQPLNNNPNVGGFGQEESQIVLQNPNRIKGMIVFFFSVTVTQILLVLKKKQFEKVQAAEMNF